MYTEKEKKVIKKKVLKTMKSKSFLKKKNFLRFFFFNNINFIFSFSLFFFLGKLKISVFVNNNKINVYLWKIKVYDSCSGENKSNRKKTIESNFENKYKKVKLSINFFRKLLDDKNDDFIYILKYIRKDLVWLKLLQIKGYLCIKIRESVV